MLKHSQSFQNITFVMSLQYRKKEVKDEVDFLHSDKYQFFKSLFQHFGHQSFQQGL